MVKRFKIQEIARERGVVNAAQLAREAWISQSTAYALWNNERNDASYSVLCAIAQVLDVATDDLVEIDEQVTRKIKSPLLVAA